MTDADAPRARNSLRLQQMARPSSADGAYERRARYNPRLRQPQPQLEFVIDGAALQQLLQDLEVPEPETYGIGNPFPYVSVADLTRPGYAAADLRRLAGDLPPDEESWPLEPGRFPLYVCPIDGDLGCGAVTVAVTHQMAVTTWSDFRLEDGYTDEEIGLDLSALGPLTFARGSYRAALLEPLGVLDALEANDQAAELEHRRARTPRGIWRSLLRPRRARRAEE